MNNASAVYGPSDLDAFQYQNHNHVFEPKNRKPQPAYGNDERSLPILTCLDCRDFAIRKLGFNVDPTKVTPTADEAEYEDRFKREGSLETQMIMREGFKAMAELGAARVPTKRTRATA